ncbi:magnesium-translocating P-type ATPase [Mycolicibacterium grossiae]|uniref:Magnesium-transporting ATPase, P-type 1 n=1 Tax=Mycolicibacterium grossiae TaxID=1552759 RepID=A0A1E8QCE6_9MYCO|nr:magnesium-translocating P-type ATPase [Mycolicibacterium grossiae]
MALSTDFALYKQNSSTPRGLTEDEAAERLARFGENRAPDGDDASLRVRAVVAVRSPFVVLLAVLGAVFATLGDLRGTVIVALVVLTAVTLRCWHHGRSSRAVRALRDRQHRTATVRRRWSADAQPAAREVPLEDVVPGDVVILEAGDRVPADVRLVAAVGLSVDQSVVSGESRPVDKHPGEDDTAPTVPALSRLCLAGSAVVTGTGTGVVVATGAATYAATVRREVAVLPRRSSIDLGVHSVVWTLVRAMLVMAAVVFVVRGAIDGGWTQAAVLAVAVAVGLTPEMLPVIVSAALGVGASRLARREVIVARLDAIGDLGAMDVLCVDKTGTLTEDRVVFAQAMDAGGLPDALPARYAATAVRLRQECHGRFDDAIAAAADGLVRHPDGYGHVDEVPFAHHRRRASVIVREPGGRDRLICHGDPDVLLERCTALRTAGAVTALTAERRAEALAVVARAHAAGRQVLAVAVRATAPRVARYDADDERDMVLVGFITLVDPVRTDAPDVLAELGGLGVSVRMLTGDARAVAVDVGRCVGMPVAGALCGRDLDRMADDELGAAVESVAVYAELTPAHKRRIVDALRARGLVVGFLGDGVNDIAALRAADAGIAADTAGEAVKDVADVVLVRPSLAVLAEAVREGRRTLVTVMTYVKITASSNLGNAMSIVAAGVLLPFVPILPVQLLVQNLLYDGAQLALAWDRVGDHRIRAPRRFRPDGLLRFMVTFGALSSVFDVVTFVVLWRMFGGAHDAVAFRTGWFLEGLLSQLLVVQVLRRGAGAGRARRPAGVVVLAAGLAAVVGCLLPLSPLANPLRMQPISLGYVGVLVGILLAYGATAALVLRLYREPA